MSVEPRPRRRIAVVGGGIAGMTAAHLLQQGDDVTLYEQEATLGGHANGVEVEDSPSRTLEVDTAFLIFNDGTYPLFLALLKQLGVLNAVCQTEMSTSYYDPRRGFLYALGKGGRGLFAQPRNLARPSFARLLWDIARFRRMSHQALEAHRSSQRTLRELLTGLGYSQAFLTDFVYPMGGAIWSLPAAAMLDFPASTFLAFFANHRQVRAASAVPPRWLSFAGSSRCYVRAWSSAFAAGGGKVVGRKVASIARDQGQGGPVRIGTVDGAGERFDEVVLATHADQALALLEQPTKQEQQLLGAWRYSSSCATLHTDPACMPPRRELWSSWNMSYDAGDLRKGARVTYHLNTVQRLDARRDYLLSLGDDVPVQDARVLKRFAYRHPIYTADAVGTQPALPSLNGIKNTYFCGSYFGFGFHEDAVRAAVGVARHFGRDLRT